MLYFKFKNYEEFKAQFGTRTGNNGKEIRSNGILLSFLKHEMRCGRICNLEVSSVNEMCYVMLRPISKNIHGDELANGMRIYHPEYSLDTYKGVCEDGDSRCIRYVRKDNGKVFKMKAGKFFRKLLEYEGITERYCEQAVIYLCEKFAEDWRVLMENDYGCGLRLHVDDNFAKIYNSRNCKGSFNSCMTDKGHHEFYEYSVEAKAAYLTDHEDLIVARCIIFTEVYEQGSDSIYRLAERQYATDQDNVLKRILVDKLIAGGHIDGYKQVGVDCHNSRAFVLNDGTSMKDKRLYIKCRLENGDTLSYQDSFKGFDRDCMEADNYNSGYFDLATTDSTYHEGSEWDEYHEEWCDEVTTAYVWRSHRDRYEEVYVNVDRLDEFYHCEADGEYYDVANYSRYCCDYIPYGESVYSEYLDDYLWAEDSSYCEEMDSYLPDNDYDYYFDRWKEDNLEWDEYNEEYVEETVSAYVWDGTEYERKNVGKDYVEFNFYEYEGEWYNELNEDDVPYNLVEELEECAV